MKNQIDTIKLRLKQMYRLKRQRAFSVFSNNGKIVFQLLSSLLHYNHPKLPGFIKDINIPSGIFNYTPSLHTQHKLTEQFAVDFDELIECSQNRSCSISALYSMGSTASIGQTNTSDLDVWICLESQLTNEQKLFLKKKAELIELWAISLGVELNLFVVDVNRFKQAHFDCLTDQNSGSAQHMLLLDEFYRSAQWLSGKFILWFAIPNQFEFAGVEYPNYEKFTQILHNEKVINCDDWIDFGPLSDMSKNEYFGGCLWQLFKSIDYPFKSLMKMILFESYSLSENNKSNAYFPFLAFDVKTKIQNGDLSDCYYLDSYSMLYEKVANYLSNKQDLERLNLINSCFYLKTGLVVDDEAPKQKFIFSDKNGAEWKSAILNQYLQRWDWSINDCKHFDQIDQWNILQLRQMDDEFLKSIMTSYKNLLDFSRQEIVDSSIEPKDVSILSRKLYASFEESQDKIRLIHNPYNINVTEPNLSFIHAKKSHINKRGWYLFNCELSADSIIGQKPIEFQPQLIQLLAWCYFNGLYTETTTLFTNDKLVNAHKLRTVLSVLSTFKKSVHTELVEHALSSPAEITELVVFVNAEYDLDQWLNNLDRDIDEKTVDVLNFGRKEQCLIKEIDVVYRNSWNELKHLHYKDDYALLKALQQLLRKMTKESDIPENIKVVSLSTTLKNEIEQTVTQYIDKGIKSRLLSHQMDTAKFMPLRIHGHSWYLFFERFDVSSHEIKNKLALFDAISTNKMKGNITKESKVSDELPSSIDPVVSEGVIQFFFEDTQKGFDLYILDEHNHVEIYRNCNTNKDAMVADVTQFYILTHDRVGNGSVNRVNFNLPQFYQLSNNHSAQQMIEPYIKINT